MVADHQEKRIGTCESGSAVDGVSVAESFGLLNEAHVAGMWPGGRSVCGLIPGADDHRDFLDAGGGDFIGKDGESGSGGPVAIDEGLEWKSALGFSSGGDYGFTNFHGPESGVRDGFGNSRKRTCGRLFKTGYPACSEPDNLLDAESP